ncbi:MAG: phosphodiester glycosidase family protein, partial [Cellvibrionaceae bacterium]
FYSNGITLYELAKYMLSIGAYDALELDGGGSATMVWKNTAGKAETLNRPIHTKIPNRQRPVANHILIKQK